MFFIFIFLCSCGESSQDDGLKTAHLRWSEQIKEVLHEMVGASADDRLCLRLQLKASISAIVIVVCARRLCSSVLGRCVLFSGVAS